MKKKLALIVLLIILAMVNTISVKAETSENEYLYGEEAHTNYDFLGSTQTDNGGFVAVGGAYSAEGEKATIVEYDKNCNIINELVLETGYFTGVLYIDNSYIVNILDIAITKYDKEGNEIWSYTIDNPASNPEQLLKMRKDKDNNIVLMYTEEIYNENAYIIIIDKDTGKEKKRIKYSHENRTIGGIEKISDTEYLIIGNEYTAIGDPINNETYRYVTKYDIETNKETFSETYDFNIDYANYGNVYDFKLKKNGNIIIKNDKNIVLEYNKDGKFLYEYVPNEDMYYIRTGLTSDNGLLILNKTIEGEIILIKYDSNGNELWNKTLDNFSNMHEEPIILLDNSIIIVGCSKEHKAIVKKINDIILENVDNGDIKIDTKDQNLTVLNVMSKDGYGLENIKFFDNNGNEIQPETVNGKFEFKGINSNITVKATFGNKYEISEYEDENSEIAFRCTGKLEYLTGVYINGEELSEDDYILKSGSTIITLQKDYADLLKDGKYTLTLSYLDGQKVSSNFSINQETEETDDQNNKVDDDAIDENVNTNLNNSDNSIASDNPQTGDNIYIYIILIIVSILSLLVTIKMFRRNLKD